MEPLGHRDVLVEVLPRSRKLLLERYVLEVVGRIEFASSFAWRGGLEVEVLEVEVLRSQLFRVNGGLRLEGRLTHRELHLLDLLDL